MRKQIIAIGENESLYHELCSALANRQIDICFYESVSAASKRIGGSRNCLVIINCIKYNVEQMAKLQALRCINPEVIMILYNRLTTPEKVAMYQNGAVVLFDKSLGMEVFISQVDALLHLLHHMNNDCAHGHPLAFGQRLIIDPRYRILIINKIPVKLTRKEFDLLYYLAKHSEMVLTYAKMYQQVWGEELVGQDIHTVQTHIWTLQKKMVNVDGNYLQHIWGVGYKFTLPSN